MLRLAAAYAVFAITVFGQSYSVYDFRVVENEIPLAACPSGQATTIRLKGTLLLPAAQAELELRCGDSADVSARFRGLQPPTRFGRNFLTYVLWAITPERDMLNLGELIATQPDRSKLHAQVPGHLFGFIVTAEPYFAVRIPSNVVVLETQVSIATPARNVTLPQRPSYTYDVYTGRFLSLNVAKPVSLEEYQAILARYEAQAAVAAAQAAGADQLATGEFQRARLLLENADRWGSQGLARSEVVQLMRQATLTAEDAIYAAGLARARLVSVAAEKQKTQLAAHKKTVRAPAGKAKVTKLRSPQTGSF